MKCKLLLILAVLSTGLFAQNNSYPQYPNPVKIPVYLSATFAELRNNAFHAGVDIKTQGVEGKEVFAVADGYVSRIGVSPYGYGKVLYITHDDGFTSVYAHLSKFNKNITAYVKSKQYENESFAQNLILEKNQFPIKRGDYLGFTGNSGSSGGPHLHYEIRYTKTQEPVNPLYFGLKINDTRKPNIKGFAIYPLENSIVNDSESAIYLDVACNDNEYELEEPLFYVNGNIAFGIDVYDQANGSNNKNGVYSIELYADDKQIFSLVSDKYSYNETRYINSLIDYSVYIKEKKRFIRTEIDKFNELKLYGNRGGVVSVNEGDTLKMKYIVKDYYDNTSTLYFTLVGCATPDIQPKPDISRNHYGVFEGESRDIYIDGLDVEIPESAFYRDVFIKVAPLDSIDVIYSLSAYQIGSEEVPLHRKMLVRMQLKDEFVGDSTLYIASIDKDGKFVYVGNKFVDNKIEAKTNVMGIFTVAKDSLAPNIKPLNFKGDSSISKNWSLRVEIEDKETGIIKYDMFVNDEWVLADYDAKNKLLMYHIDNHMKKGHNTLRVVVTDMVGNVSVYETTLQR